MSASQLAGSHPSIFELGGEIRLESHESVRLHHDEKTGLKAIIAIHDSRLGPALGGTRFYPYASDADALTDVLRLSEGMTYKAAAAGLPLGGGKAVIIGDPATLKSPELLEEYGRFVDSLGGRYITAGDVGTTSDDMDVIGRTTSHVVARTAASGGSGDSGFSTAFGVFSSIEAAVRVSFGRAPLAPVTVGVEGAGKVGFQLIGLLLEAGARVVFSEQSPAARDRVHAAYPEVDVRDSVIDAEVDVYAPCALGATLTHDSVGDLKARIVCGAANNQLLTDSVEDDLARRGILWVPDYVANAGGLIQVAAELRSNDSAGVHDRVGALGAFVETMLIKAATDAVTPGRAAREIVDRRLDQVTGAIS
ncbi:Glu/Leu/Phe/Val family dehydrogenase [Aeromicrobium endophyticum]|uniref:Glu/Leu/Phe/Val dehydrogenase n=1 Tax=Aeromicrobium endophyticum TaxID=2292704 RepID=A0A371PCI4_9ACTN|nr:Glu/Leu/Phe/Val dehydrogenase dimerization domain-containing protein [Aeromicrobium endophyticum]REK73613.1 Glu/Leu/Phe/Val dehydrogenase [Aeromicrobium endophyticum]